MTAKLPVSHSLRELCQSFGTELHSRIPNQMHFLVTDGQRLLKLGEHLRNENFYLVTAFANDERELEDHSFKIYYLFSHPVQDLFLFIEQVLPPEKEEYESLEPSFPAVAPFEREMAELFGLFPSQAAHPSRRASFLHAPALGSLYPLRRDCSQSEIQAALAGFPAPLANPGGSPPLLPEGEMFLPVGPIHAGVIEPGVFLFRMGNETRVEELQIHLGYTHKGIERQFQNRFDLQTGWRLAEGVSGDSAFAHSLAYCQAVEALAGVVVPAEASLLRGVFLELERVANHIGDCAALAHDMALDLPASDMAVLREKCLRLHSEIAGDRFLRGMNRPGGVLLPQPLEPGKIIKAVAKIIQEYLGLARLLTELNGFRERTIQVGVLSKEQATQIGVTGLVARASGIERDFRIQHPFGPYGQPNAQGLLRTQMTGNRLLDLMSREMRGDVFSRFLMRVQEVNLSAHLIDHFLEQWPMTDSTDFCLPLELERVNAFDFGIGYAEGWRGDVIYWVMKDKFNRIYRCKVRDPSTLNWPGLKVAMEPQTAVAPQSSNLNQPTRWETALADFPIINKSFNLSYSGNDL